MSRPVKTEDVKALYSRFATAAVEFYNAQHEFPPMLAAVVMRDEPGEMSEAVFMHPELVNLFHRSASAKDALMALVRTLLAEGEAAGWQHLLEFDRPFVPEAVVHVSEAWVIDGSVSEHPDRGEALIVTIHTGHGTCIGTCPIDDNATPKRATLGPLMLDGRFSLNEGEADGPIH